MLIDFNKPTKVTVEYGFESGPTGGYMPQMSDEDAAKWRGKRVNKGKDGDRIEIRKSFAGCQILIFVAKDGWVYSKKNEGLDPVVETVVNKWYNPNDVDVDDPYDKPTHDYVRNVPTRGLNVRISMNGPLMMSFEQYDEMCAVIDEARTLLKEDA